MRKELGLPENVEGEWIWSASLTDNAGSYLLMRQSFQTSAPGMDNLLWITSSCAYQLFINERFIGFGPRARQGDRACVDVYEISGEIQSGSNAVSVIVYDDPLLFGNRRHVQGMWCQLECDGRVRLKSDSSWMVRRGSCMMGPRPRAGELQLMTELINNQDVPEHWTRAMYLPGGGWHKPDRCTPVSELGAGLGIYPLPPAMVDSPVDFEYRDSGKVVMADAWTQVVFGPRHRNRCAVCAAETYLYWNSEADLKVQISADDPFRFFCNSEEIASGTASFADKEYILPLKTGWNRLLVLQTPGLNSMGVFLLFPGMKQEDLQLLTSSVEGCEAGWRVAGPLKLPLADATPSLWFDRLDSAVYQPQQEPPVDQAARLQRAEFRKNVVGENTMTLHTGEYIHMSLDILRYGFPVLEVEGSAGDVLDLSLGHAMADNGFPFCGEQSRSTHRLTCRNGVNFFRLFLPREVLEIVISVRNARSQVKIHGCFFEELAREPLNTTSFQTSNETLNTLWNIGLHTLRRSSAFVPQVDPNTDHVCYLVDAYIDAVNMVATFGDTAYAATRLRQFAEAQFENGDIPALSFGDVSRSQVPHLFFFPVWMAYNFRTSGDLDELRALEPNLRLLLDFFYSLVDEEVGLLGDCDERIRLESRLSIGKFGKESFPTYANSLFCLALISAAEVFRFLGNDSDAESTLENAAEIAARLRDRNFDESVQLFRQSTERDSSASNDAHNLFANFTALIGGLMKDEEVQVFFETYFTEEPPYDRSPEARNPYFHFFFMETMFALDQKEWAAEYFQEYWRRRICKDSGSWLTWRGTPSFASLRFQNGNLVSPNVFLVREVAGVRAADPAHSAVYLSPALNLADYVDMTLPTGSGIIRLKWEKLDDGGLRIRLESTYPLRVLPELPPELLAETEFVLSENVTLLQRDSVPDDGGEDLEE